MGIASHSLDLFVDVAFWTIVHSLWQGAILAGALALWRRFSGESDPGVRCGASTLTLFFLALAPVATAAVVAAGHRPRVEPTPPELAAALPAFAASGATLPDDGWTIAAEASTPRPPTRLTLDGVVSALPRLIALCWTLGVAWGAARIAISAVRLEIVRRRSPVACDALAERCRALAKRCGLSRAPRLVLSNSARGPYAFGLLRPCVALPAAWLLETTPEALEAAIAHELAHLKRRDLWILALQRCVETTLFFHPGVWYVARTLDAERERDADRVAARLLGDPARYAESLCRLASLVDPSPSAALTVPFHGETRMRLLERVRHVLRSEEAGSGATASVGWLCLAPALLAAIFLGQAALVGSLHADDPQREVADDPRAAADDDGKDDGERGREAGREDRDDDDDADDREEGRAADLRRRFAAEKDAIAKAVRAEAEKIEQAYKERMAQLEQEMARAQAQLEAAAKQKIHELELRMAEAARAQSERRGERRDEGNERIEGLDLQDAEDLTPRERRLMGVIRALEARLRAVEARGSRGEWQDEVEQGGDREDREGDRREGREERREDGNREGDRRQEGDRPRERGEREGERADPKESPEQEVRERESDARSARRAPRSEEEALQQQRDHFAQRLYNALRGEGILEERKPEFVRRAILDVLEFELNDDQIRVVLERAQGDFDGFRQVIARIAAAEKE